MNSHLWSELYLTVHQPLFEDTLSGIDLALFPSEKYPALHQLKNQSLLEISLLAHLILQAEEEDPENQYCSEEGLQELFESYDCTPLEVWNALMNLKREKWVELFVDLADDSIHFKAMLLHLELDDLYTPNPWRHLYQLRLLGAPLHLN